jgi:hypothetical protein
MRIKHLLCVVLAAAAIPAMASEKATADEMINQAKAVAAKQNKSIFVKYDASW